MEGIESAMGRKGWGIGIAVVGGTYISLSAVKCLSIFPSSLDEYHQ